MTHTEREKNPGRQIARAQQLVASNHLTEALAIYVRVIAQDPKNTRILIAIGDLRARLGQTKRAIDTYIKVAELFTEQRFYLKAVAVYKQILKLDQNRVELNLRLAELYKHLGLLSDAMIQYQAAADFYKKRRRVRESLAALRQIIDLDPESTAIRLALAEQYLKAGMRSEAVTELTAAEAYLRGNGRADDAATVTRRIAEITPTA